MSKEASSIGRRFKSLFEALLLATLMAVAGTVSAVPAYTIASTTGETLDNEPFTLGWVFDVNAPITLSALGIFDAGLDGLAQSHAVGLWDSAGTLLASTTIGAGDSATLVNQFRYVPIGNLVLAAASGYRIGAYYLVQSDDLVFPTPATGFATAPEITFTSSAFVSGSELAFPINAIFPEPAYFGPNFLFNEVKLMPLPAGLALFALALAALGWSRGLSQRR